MGNVNFAPGGQVIQMSGSTANTYFLAYSHYTNGMFEIQSIRLISGRNSYTQQFKFYIASGLDITGTKLPTVERQFAAPYAYPGSIANVIDKSTPLFLRAVSSGAVSATPRIRCDQGTASAGADTYWEVVYKFYRNINIDGVSSQNSFGLVNDLE